MIDDLNLVKSTLIVKASENLLSPKELDLPQGRSIAELLNEQEEQEQKEDNNKEESGQTDQS